MLEVGNPSGFGTSALSAALPEPRPAICALEADVAVVALCRVEGHRPSEDRFVVPGVTDGHSPDHFELLAAIWARLLGHEVTFAHADEGAPGIGTSGSVSTNHQEATPLPLAPSPVRPGSWSAPT